MNYKVEGIAFATAIIRIQLERNVHVGGVYKAYIMATIASFVLKLQLVFGCCSPGRDLIRFMSTCGVCGVGNGSANSTGALMTRGVEGNNEWRIHEGIGVADIGKLTEPSSSSTPL